MILDDWTIADIEAAIARDEPSELLLVPILVSLSPPNRIWAEQICIRLSKHPHPSVRGNAILGFGHLARLFRYLNRSLVKPIIVAGLQDEDASVRGQAHDAADDVEWFAGWMLPGREEKWMQGVCPLR